MPSTVPVVLASSSRYKRALLARLLDDFQSVAPALDETPRAGEAAEPLARRLAREKAERIARRHPGALVIGADQVAVQGSRVLGKPGDHANGLAQLLAASGREVRFLTAACVLEPSGRRRHEHTDLTVVRFRRFGRDLAASYLRRDEPYDCAGSFRVEGAGSLLFEAVVTEDPSALIGLPMIWLAATLLELGGLPWARKAPQSP